VTIRQPYTIISQYWKAVLVELESTTSESLVRVTKLNKGRCNDYNYNDQQLAWEFE